MDLQTDAPLIRLYLFSPRNVRFEGIMTQQLWSPSIRIIICMFGAEYQEFIRKCVNKVLAVVKWNRILNIDRQSLFHIIINLICDPWYNNDMLKCISL